MSTPAGLVLILVVMAAGVAAAEQRPMTDPELASQRGGIMTPMGIDIGFAADVRTYVDGHLALQTSLVWTDQGAKTSQTGDPAAIAAGGSTTGAAGGRWGAVVPGAGGVTNILQDLTNGRIAGVVVNTASDRTVRQDTNITLTLPQLTQMQGQLRANLLASNLQNATTLALRGSAASGH